jgi:biopolymer transport protein TolR
MSVYMNQRGGRSHRRHTKAMSEINVTPFVDVMLVLLVIFMVTAPLLTVGVKVDLPKTKASVIEGGDEPLAVSIDAGGNIYLQDSAVDLDGLVPRLQAITHNNPDVRIFVRGDQAINYGRVMSVMGTINSAGYKRVALVTRRSDKKQAKKKGAQ